MSIDHLLAISWQVNRLLAVKYTTYVHRNFIKDSQRALSSRSLFEQLSLCGWCRRDELLSWMRMLMRTYTMFFFSKGDLYQAQRQLLTIPLRDNGGCTIEVVAPFMVLKDISHHILSCLKLLFFHFRPFGEMTFNYTVVIYKKDTCTWSMIFKGP